jgi:predicted type IV restriction endonuclease
MEQPTISENALRQLVQLYGKQQEVVPQPIGTQEASQMTEFKLLPNYQQTKTKMVIVTPRSKAQKAKITADLSDVDLD